MHTLSESVKIFRKRWNVNWDEKTSSDHFRNRLLFLMDKYFASVLIGNKEILNKFAYYCGLPSPYLGSGRLDGIYADVMLREHGVKDTIIFSAISTAESSAHLAWYLQNLFIVLDDAATTNDKLHRNLSMFTEDLKDLFKATPSVQIRISKTKKGIIFYPAGAKLLDENLVNQNLEWLQDYPESLKAFEQALSIYLSGDKLKFRNLIDNLRVAIEQLLRKVLNNQKSLENQKELDTWLEKHGVHKQIRNLYGQMLFNQFATLQNDVAKHGDVELLPDEIEYIIYLTGIFMRLIIQLRRSEA